MRCGGASLEDGALPHPVTTNREKGVSSAGDRTGF